MNNSHLAYLGKYLSFSLFFVILGICMSHAQSKTELQGFYPGMTEESLNRRVNELKLSCGVPIIKFIPQTWTCCSSTEDTSSFCFNHTNYLNPNVISSMYYYFLRSKGAGNIYNVNEMISLVSSTFGSTPSGKTRNTEGDIGILGQYFYRPDAIWELKDETYLALAGTHLGLWNRKIIRDDNNAMIAKIKSTTPPPKF
jgi:hypothetical protein